MAKYQIIEPAFSSRQTANYKLSILPGVDSLVYMVYNNQFELLLLDRISVPATEDRRPDYASVLQNESLLQHHYGEVRVAMPGAIHTLVPERLFGDADLFPYLQHLTALPPGTELVADRLDKLNATMIYAFDPELTRTFLQTFGNVQFYHLGSALIQGSAQLQENFKSERVFLYVQDRRLHVLSFRGEELFFYNAFEFSDGKDFVYYAMLAYHQFKLSTEHVPCLLCGDIEEDSELYKLLYRYVRHLSFSPPSLTLRMSDNGQKLFARPSRYFALFGLHFCNFSNGVRS